MDDEIKLDDFGKALGLTILELIARLAFVYVALNLATILRP
jgi:hypothetical protein